MARCINGQRVAIVTFSCLENSLGSAGSAAEFATWIRHSARIRWAGPIEYRAASIYPQPVAGLFERLDLVHLPDTLAVLDSPWVIGVAAALAVVEFLADKIPAFDFLWDAIHTFIRIPAGALLGITLALFVPLLCLALIIAFLLCAGWALPRLVKGVRGGFGRDGQAHGAQCQRTR
ncbi:MAG: Putative transmembrane protein [Candidatus Burkholderia crenata]|nr:MAG: Putative transmembrane protein [Candidatus Burkholderia crenata]